MKQLRKSSTLNLHSHSRENTVEYIKAGLEFLKNSGFDASDCPIGLFDISGDGWKAQTEQILKAQEEIGLKFEIGHLPFIGGGGEKTEEYMKAFDKKMKNAIEVGAALGLEYAVMHPNAGTEPLIAFDRKARYDSVMNHLSPYVEYANKAGLNVVVENMRVFSGARISHRYCQTPDELCEVADALGVGVCLDFGHANISGIKQSEGLAYVGKRLKVIHVNDNTGIDDDHVPPFCGSVDWKDAMHGLAIAEFDGLFNYEIAAGRLPDSVRPAFAKYLSNAADEIMTYIG